ncbi:MAG: hypothetical protein ACLSCW_10670 [Gemmiger formicilis]|uniref:hypothetical protein n=1 Tax=Gemmiger formicilis TaxID=745368 RepID=UPI0032C048E7
MLDKSYIYQVSIREWIENDWDKGIFVPVYGGRKDDKWDIFFQSYLVPADRTEEQLKTDTYDAYGLLRPGVTVYGAWDSGEAAYYKWGNNTSIEPLVIKRDYNDLARDNIEIVEEFRFLFNLYYNSQSKEYVDLENDTSVVKISDDNLVSIHKRYLKSYLAIKNMALIIHIDSRCTDIVEDIFPTDSFDYRNDDNTVFYTVNIGRGHNGIQEENFSILFGKKVLFGCKLKDCNIWPYNEKKQYIEFIVGVDDNGRELHYTCDPSKLSNYFGANPDAPHYLTPIFFDSAVLSKYYSNPEKYKVDDGIIRCGTLWSLYIDNQNTGYVSAYLGDLGRNLPSEQEQHYWRGFNKALDAKLSATKFKRDFMALPASSQSQDFVFKNTYVKTNRQFAEKAGWPLFLELDEQDRYNFEGLRIPINNSIVEMDMLVLSLVKVLLDSLNEKEIVSHLTGTYEKLVGSIAKLEVWFQEKQLTGYQDHIKFLRNLQELRSSGTGHRKGKSYQKISKVFDIQKENYTETFSNILESATLFLNYINTHIEELSK